MHLFCIVPLRWTLFREIAIIIIKYMKLLCNLEFDEVL